MTQPLGPQGCQQRMEEIQAKMDRAFGRNSPVGPSFQNAANHVGLSGEITPQGTVAPMSVGGLEIRPAEGKSSLQPLIEKAAQQNNVDPRLLDALIQTESDYNPMCRSGAGAMGLAQLMPETARTLGVTNPFDPWQSLNGGAKYLRQMLDKFGNVEHALAAYNAGPGAVARSGGIPPYTETQNYVKKILRLYQGGAQ